VKHFFVYIIYSSLYNIYYIGQTNDLDDRIISHNSNRYKFTKGKCPWELISSIKFNSRSEALKLERKLKNMKISKKAIDYRNKLVQSIPTYCREGHRLVCKQAGMRLGRKAVILTLKYLKGKL